ncbi:MAG: lytic transglycosylase domain-containing protein [Nocardioides sp.]
MSRHRKYVPRHRDVSATVSARSSRRVVSTALVLGGVSAAVTGTAVYGGSWAVSQNGPSDRVTSAVDDTASRPSSGLAVSTGRAEPVSRSDRRGTADPAKQAELGAFVGGAVTGTEDLSGEDPRVIARALLAEFGFSADQFDCLDALYESESGWRVDADNPSSSAYGIPQALPGSKMASEGADWRTNPVTQIRWGLGYIEDRYGTPCAAWSFKRAHNWY